MSFLGLSRPPSPSEMIYNASTEIFKAATAEQGKFLTENDKTTDLIDILCSRPFKLPCVQWLIVSRIVRAHAGAGQVKGGMSEEQAVSQVSILSWSLRPF
jgi:hypothetical protein